MLDCWTPGIKATHLNLLLPNLLPDSCNIAFHLTGRAPRSASESGRGLLGSKIDPGGAVKGGRLQGRGGLSKKGHQYITTRLMYSFELSRYVHHSVLDISIDTICAKVFNMFCLSKGLGAHTRR